MSAYRHPGDSCRSDHEFAGMLLEAIVSSDIYEAVLDDGD
jgi:hypothetical protein